MKRKILWSLGIFLVLGIVSLWWLGGQAPLPTASNQTGNNLIARAGAGDAPITIQRQVQTDSDGDGLADWEEVEFWGTSANNPDTDGDGTPDGEEVNRGWDPLTPGPADQTLDEDARAVALVRQAGQSKNAPLLPAESVFQITSARRYELSDLKLVENDDPVFLKNYGQQIAEALGDYADPELQNDMELTLAALEGSEIALTRLEFSAERHQRAVSNLLAVTAPRAAGHIHLHLVNALSQIAAGAALMAELESEPAAALAASNLHPSRVQNLFAAADNLNLFFIAYGVRFAPNERAGISLGF